MYNTVKKFFVLNHHLTLPGIGHFFTDESRAQIIFTNKTIEPSLVKIRFDNSQPSAEKTFFTFIANELNIDEAEAIKSYTDFSDQLTNLLSENKPVILNGIGELKKNTGGAIQFQPEQLPEYFPLITAERIIRKNVSHTVRVGEDEKTSEQMHFALQPEEVFIKEERWWIPALILATIGIAALAYYYLVLHPSN